MKKNKKQKELEDIAKHQAEFEKKTKCLVFDLDGTLVDSLEDIATCCNKILETHNLPVHEIDDYRQFLGNGSLYLVQQAVGEGYSEEFYTQILNEYLAEYTSFPCRATKAYKGITNMLKYCSQAGYYLVIATNKPRNIASSIIHKLFATVKFDLVLGADSLDCDRKPAKDIMEYIKKTFILSDSEIMLIGDSEVDFEFAKNSNIQKYYSFYHGFRTKEELIEAGVTNFLDKPRDIITILSKEGAYSQTGWLTLSLVSFFIGFLTSFGFINTQYEDYFLWVTMLIYFIISFVLIGIFLIPYFLKRTYLNYRPYLSAIFFIIGGGSFLCSIVVAKSLDPTGLIGQLTGNAAIFAFVILGSCLILISLIMQILYIHQLVMYTKKER